MSQLLRFLFPEYRIALHVPSDLAFHGFAFTHFFIHKTLFVSVLGLPRLRHCVPEQELKGVGS